MKKYTQKIFVNVLQSREELKKIMATYFVITCGIFLILLFLVWQNYLEVLSDRKNELKNLSYWEFVLSFHPNYPDAYYQSALYAARVGSEAKALLYINKALDLDPNFQKANNLRNELEKN